MKKLRRNQLGAWCDYCPLNQVRERAVFVSRGWRNKACGGHKHLLQKDEDMAAERDARYTEADDQTWGRL